MEPSHEGLNSAQIGIIACVTTMLALSTLSFVLRIFSRWKFSARLWWDDYTAFAALILSYGPSICALVALKFGKLGQHESTVGKENVSFTLMCSWITELTWRLPLPFIKISLLILDCRTFPGPRLRTASKVVAAFMLSWLIATTIVQTKLCTPLQYFWNRGVPNGTCLNHYLFDVIDASLNLTTDIVVFCMPLPIIWQLRLSTAKRLGLAFIFTIGGFACTASVVRIATLGKIDPLDITGSTPRLVMWAAAEVSIGTISCNVPAAAPLFLSAVRYLSERRKPSKPKGYALSQGQRERFGFCRPNNHRLGQDHGFTTIDHYGETQDIIKHARTSTGTLTNTSTPVDRDESFEKITPHGSTIRTD